MPERLCLENSPVVLSEVCPFSTIAVLSLFEYFSLESSLSLPRKTNPSRMAGMQIMEGSYWVLKMFEELARLGY